MTDRDDYDGDRATSGIEVRDVGVSFGDLTVLESASLTVSSGEFVGLVGPNGAGKTTLLRTISGVIAPDAGSVTIDGLDVHDASSRVSSRHVAVVPQDTTLSFSFPVRDVVAMGRHPHRSRFSGPTLEDREAVEAALERTRTAELADRPIDEVSGGQRQRVVLARAVAQETPALLLDEPTANLDINHQIETLELVRELVAEGKTVVAAIHDLSLAARYCDRLALLAEGGIHSVGPPEEVLSTSALADAFDANAAVTTNPITGTPSVTAVADAELSEGADREDAHVHVVGAGQAASSVLTRLALSGLDVTLGPVPARDSALETVERFDLDAQVVDPFSPLSETGRTRVEEWLRAADVTVLADPVVGDGPEFEALLETIETRPSLVDAERELSADRSTADRASRRLSERCRDGCRTTTPTAIVDAVTAELEGTERGAVSNRSDPSGLEDRTDIETELSTESPSD
ncbi:ATP-binding cassette domain-containing protein [Halopiger goleimassiliensis]|uniref:ATP-binding cassette domain-containing protein n=1 Tax=Halopiger goleimassiliensis TaxID=1293048 RepID=UPI0009DC164C|nr:ATP-binding cassette domain-containing protein [Halopiger goleimassiliensis]